MMRRLITKIIIGMLLLLAASASSVVSGQPGGGKCHVLLLDVSGSMKNRYAGDLKNWLIQPLLTSSGFSPNDRVLVRWFDHRGNADFSADDKQRRYFNNLNAQAVLDQVPTAQDANGLNTNLSEAVNLTLADIKNLQIQGDVLIWMLTDNVQDVGGTGDANELYQNIKDNENFRAAYLFPLVKEKDGRPPAESAMVLYLLSYSPNPSSFKLDNVADSASKKINNPTITWFPLQTGIGINESNITVNGEPAMTIDGKLKLPAVAEGETPDFTIRFPFTSRLRARKIVSSQIKRQQATLDNLPTSLEAQGDVNSWNVDISPKTLTIEPNKNSEVIYETTIRASDMSLRPASFWDALLNSTSDPVEVRFQYTLEDVETKIDSPEIAQVKNLQEIENNLRPSQKNIRPGKIPMSFQVQYNSTWRRLMVAALIVFALALLGVAAFALGSKSRYELSSSLGEQTLELPLIGRSYITINGDRAAVITKKFGKMTVAPLGAYLLNGELTPQRLEENAENSFMINNRAEARRYSYTLRRLVRQQTTPVKDDHSWDL